jgi:hypothetical protein
MRNSWNREGGINGRTMTAVVVGLVVLVLLLLWGPWNTPHVASNPGPSGTPGSTIVDRTPPPADGPSGNTSGAAR